MQTTLLVPSEDAWSWQLAARCREEDVNVFFPADGERGHALEERERRAKAICAQCVVAEQCRGHAMHYGEPFGTWGGLSERERTDLLGKRRSPTKAD